MELEQKEKEGGAHAPSTPEITECVRDGSMHAIILNGDSGYCCFCSASVCVLAGGKLELERNGIKGVVNREAVRIST